jgi:hypothetical protein
MGLYRLHGRTLRANLQLMGDFFHRGGKQFQFCDNFVTIQDFFVRLSFFVRWLFLNRKCDLTRGGNRA